jgi:hypothetical protein
MAFTTVYKDIVFSEGNINNAEILYPIEVDLSFVFGAQLKSLRDVKDNLVEQAKAGGYNAIVNFQYGQKSRWLAIDDVAFWGKGYAAKIDENTYNVFLKKSKN